MQDLNGLGGDGWETVLVEEMNSGRVWWVVEQWSGLVGEVFG
jgi:hypothetical protein